MTSPMLQLQNVTVDLDGFKASNDLSLTIESGSMIMAIGPHGAGIDDVRALLRHAAQRARQGKQDSPDTARRRGVANPFVRVP